MLVFSCRAAILFAVLGVIPIPAAHAEGLQAGLWKTVTRPAADGVAGPVRESMRCLTPEAVGDLERTFSPIAKTTNSACKHTVHVSTPRRLRWQLTCIGQLDMDVQGDFNFERPDRYTATVLTNTAMLGKPLQSIRAEIEAERVGDCPPQ
jgi:hypothetical protein